MAGAAFAKLIPSRQSHPPWRALASHRSAACFQRPDRQRAIGGRIQATDIARDIERMSTHPAKTPGRARRSA